jgi:hypothetical protein
VADAVRHPGARVVGLAESRIAATVTAILGVKAPVAIEVAIAFAVSWNPLVKSKIKAVATTTTTITVTSMRAFPMIGTDDSAPLQGLPPLANAG